MEGTYKYFAFISYNAKDTEWGRRVQRKLESYRMPSTLCSQRGWQRKPLRPIFFAPTDIQPGGLSAELQERLKASRNLIVICSPNSAKSKWVGKEIEYFHSLGRTDNIHFFIVDGEPHSGNPDTECFNPVVQTLGLPEILGANIHERVSRWAWINRERAYVQLITKLLGVEFDSIWQRHKRQLIQECVAWAVGIVEITSALLGTWLYNQPVDVQVKLNETTIHNDNLYPLHNAVVSLMLDDETKTDTIATIDNLARFANIPREALGKTARLRITCNDWLTTDTIVTLAERMTLNIARDPHPYGDIQFGLWNPNTERTYPGITVSIRSASGRLLRNNGHTATADAQGRVSYTMPLAEQDTLYIIEAPLPLEYDTLHMPTTESTIVEVK